MIIHSPIISGSLIFAQGATFTLPSGGVYSGSFSGSINGIGDPQTFSASVDTRIDQLAIDTGSQDGRLDNLEGFTSSIDTTIKNKLNTETVISGSSQVSYPNLSNIPSGIVSGSSQVTSLLPAGVVSGSSQVVGILSSLNSYTASNDTTNTTQTTRLNQLSTASGSAIGRLSNLELTSASLLGETLNLELYTASNDTKWSTLGALSGSFARTNSSNIFNGNQTITGSLFISQDLVVAGSSSIQNISSSNLVIGSSYVTLNTFSPSSRFAGLLIVDSGSSGGSGSFLYDSLQDELLFIHRGNGVNTTSSVLLLGPETYDNLGNETYLTNNRLPKATGKEHLVDSTISDDGTTVNITGALTVTGNITGTIRSTNGVVSGSSQIDVASTTGDIALGTRTSGNYVATITAGNGIVSSGATTGEGIAHTISAGGGVVSGSSQISHDSTTGYSANRHIDHTSITLTAGDGLTGGGTIADSRTFNVVGTTNRISVSADAVDIASTYVGQTSITTLGTIGTGNWQGSVIASAYLDADTAHLSDTQTFTGAKTFSSAVNITNSTASTTITTGALIVTGGVGVSGALNVGGDVVAYASSDKRLKDNIKNIENPIQKVQKLNGVTWDWNSNADELQQSLPNVGVIAQEVEEVLPQLVHNRDNGFKGVDYAKLTGLLIEAIKEQQKQIDELKSKLV